MSTWEGAVAIRRDAFDYAGGWPDPFWYAHEGIELAWRVWDAGYQARYDGGIEVHHPAIKPTRHAEFYRFQARNRVWLARRNLPVPVGVLYVAAWVVVGGVRLRSQGRVGGNHPRLPGRAPGAVWRASADFLAHSLADGEGRPPAGDLTREIPETAARLEGCDDQARG